MRISGQRRPGANPKDRSKRTRLRSQYGHDPLCRTSTDQIVRVGLSELSTTTLTAAKPDLERKMHHKSALVGIAGLLVSVAAGTAMADIATNGGFELGTGGDSDSWSEFFGGAPGTVSARTMADAISGSWSHQILAVGDSTVGGFAVITQNSINDGGLPSLEQNTPLSVSFDAVTDFGPGGVGFLAIRVLNGAGAIVADSGLQPFFNGANSSPVINVPAFGGGDNDTYSAFVEIVVNSGAFDGSYAGALIDNVNIDGTVVPAPASAALVAIGGLVGLRRRR